ncbi:MAG: signal transduction histidine kinase [Sulfurimonas sp.]|jgi:signal transduction histidine kinase
MNKIKIISSLSFFLLFISTLSYIYFNIEDIYSNEFIFVDMYEEMIEKIINAESLNKLVELTQGEEAKILYAVFIFRISLNILILSLFTLLLFYFSRGQIYVKKNFTLLKTIIIVFFLQTILITFLEMWYVDFINNLINVDAKIRDSFFYERLESIASIFIMLIISWIFFESINLKNKSAEYEMQKKFLLQQHKLSQLGQLLGFITHEWKEPLNRISSYFVSMQISNTSNKDLTLKLDKCQKQIDHMNNTMSSFKSFYKSDSKENYFYFDKAVNYILGLLKDELLMNNIHISYKNNNHNKIKGHENDFSQIILILLNNSKEAFNTKGIKNKKITIVIQENIIYFNDSAGGVEIDDIRDIFLTEFTTKSENMGIGLYIAKLILEEKFNANIEVRNAKQGVEFTILLPKEGISA